MTYNYLDLVNKVLARFNEVALTSSDFASVVGFYQDVKNSVNDAIRDIYEYEDTEWPFAYDKTNTLTLTIGDTGPYTLDSSLEKVDWDSFYIPTANNVDAVYLPVMNIDQYRQDRLVTDSKIEFDADTDSYETPTRVVRDTDNKAIFTPVPDVAYVVHYSGFTAPTLLSAYNDVPAIPEAYASVIVDGATKYAYMFRDNVEQAARQEETFIKRIARMRRILIPSTEYMRFKE